MGRGFSGTQAASVLDHAPDRQPLGCDRLSRHCGMLESPPTRICNSCTTAIKAGDCRFSCSLADALSSAFAARGTLRDFIRPGNGLRNLLDTLSLFLTRRVYLIYRRFVSGVFDKI